MNTKSTNRRLAGIAVVTILGASWLFVSNSVDNPPVHHHGSGDADIASHSHGPPESSASHTKAQMLAAAQAPAKTAVPNDDISRALGGNWKDYKCELVKSEIVLVPSGELVEGLMCEDTAKQEPHAFESYSNESLASLAFSDPLAGVILGRRLVATQPDQSWELMIRSSAMLGGDTRPIKWLAATAFNRVSIDGEIAVGDMQLRYVLDTLSKRLDNAPDAPRTFRDIYLKDSLNEDEFAQLDGMVDNLIQKMKTIESETTGSSTITG